MPTEVLTALNPQPGMTIIDGTFGRGGHTRLILKTGAKVIGLDHDQDAIAFGQEAFAEELATGQLHLVRANFTELAKVLKQVSVETVNGILLDLGASTDQLLSQTRGFSFQGSTALDMRMDDRLGVTAADLLAILPEKQLAELFITYGGEEQARSIAKTLAYSRTKQPIKTTDQLVAIIERVKGPQRGPRHPATKIFQALRIAVNTELDNATQALPTAFQVLAPQGILTVLSFHDGEDRIVKQFMKKQELTKLGIMSEPQLPSEKEVAHNPKARSAKLRILKKL
jgi:16S rRNA (cytosine1402-N4)-methyltransferase